MKIIATAIALAFAFPAAAQPAPAQHQGHAQHPQGQPDHGVPGEHPGQHGEHRDGCCADRDGNGRMDCCEQAEGQREACQHHEAGGH